MVVDPRHIHLIEAWPELPKWSDQSGAATIESFEHVEMPGAEGLAVEVALGGDVTGDGVDDLVMAGRADGKPVLRVHTDLANDLAAFTDLANIDGLGARVLAVSLLPREDLGVSEGGGVDLVLALENRGAAVVRFDGTQFVVVEQLDLKEITTVGVGDVDGDQFADVVLVSPDKVQVFLRTLRYAGDEAASVEAGEP